MLIPAPLTHQVSGQSDFPQALLFHLVCWRGMGVSVSANYQSIHCRNFWISYRASIIHPLLCSHYRTQYWHPTLALNSPKLEAVWETPVQSLFQIFLFLHSYPNPLWLVSLQGPKFNFIFIQLYFLWPPLRDPSFLFRYLKFHWHEVWPQPTYPTSVA